MTINIFVLKGDLNGKIVVVRFFFCRVYIHEYSNEIICIFIIGSTSYISTLFGTMFGSPGYKAAEI